MTTKLASAGLTADQLNDIVEMLGGYEKALKFLRGELLVYEPTRLWREQDGVIYFSVTSDGTTGEDWINRLESKRFYVSDSAKEILRTYSFEPTSGVTTEIAVLRGCLFKSTKDRSTKNIRTEGALRKLSDPGAEVACLIREKFTDREIRAMGLCSITAMHVPIRCSKKHTPLLLTADLYANGRLLHAYRGHSTVKWHNPSSGFAFAVREVSSET